MLHELNWETPRFPMVIQPGMRVNVRYTISTSTHMPGESYRRWFNSFWLCSCKSFQALTDSLSLLTLHKHSRPLSVSDYGKYLLLTCNNNKNHASLCCDERPLVRPSMTNTFPQRLSEVFQTSHEGTTTEYTFVPLFVTFALFQGYKLEILNCKIICVCLIIIYPLFSRLFTQHTHTQIHRIEML